MDLSGKVFYGLLALGTLGALGAGLVQHGPGGLIFDVCAVMVVGGSLLCVWERSVVRSAFALLGTFGGTAGLFVLLGADFLALAQILIYVGGILALLLFGVMLTPPDMGERKLSRVVSGLVLMGAAVVWVSVKVAATVEWAQSDVLPTPVSSARQIGVGFLAPDEYVIAFELAAVVLTVALVAAVYIARRSVVDVGPGEMDRREEAT
jgi:NADH-quinone oxidoreductase subunit J